MDAEVQSDIIINNQWEGGVVIVECWLFRTVAYLLLLIQQVQYSTLKQPTVTGFGIILMMPWRHQNKIGAKNMEQMCVSLNLKMTFRPHTAMPATVLASYSR